jgi:hypothetical protein
MPQGSTKGATLTSLRGRDHVSESGSPGIRGRTKHNSGDSLIAA